MRGQGNDEEYVMAVPSLRCLLRWNNPGTHGIPLDVELKAAEEGITERLRSRSGVISKEMLENIKESRITRLARDSDRYKTLSRRTKTLLSRDKKSYVRGLTEDVKDCLKTNGLTFFLSSKEAPVQSQISDEYYQKA